MYRYPVNRNLCIYPTEPYERQETQFEAFQSVLATMLSAEEDSPYMALASMYELPVVELELKGKYTTKPDGIYYKPAYRGSTHYVAVRGGQVYNPYDYYQPPNTQGFCQLFAFFLAIGDIEDFQRIPKGIRSTSRDTFDKYAYNTYTALQKLLVLLNDNRELDAHMEVTFGQLPRANYGIRCRSYARFKRDLSLLTLDNVRFYIIDQTLPGESYAQRSRLWAYVWDSR